MQDDMPGGWKFLTGDVNWEDYGGSWFKRQKNTERFFVVRYENGHEYDKELPRHLVSLVSVDVGELMANPKQLKSVLGSWSYRLVGDEIVSDSGDVLAVRGTDTWYHVLVDCAVGYGAYAPHEEFNGDKHMMRLRAEARREGERLMRDEIVLAASLARPVNKIGSTAAEYARGDIKSALSRGPSTPEQGLMRHLQGMSPRADAPVVRTIMHAAMRACPFSIVAPEHYNEDGRSCKCDDAAEQARMISEWGYTADQFADAGVEVKS